MVIPSLESIKSLSFEFCTSTNLEYFVLVDELVSIEKFDIVSHDCIKVKAIPPRPGATGGRFVAIVDSEAVIMMIKYSNKLKRSSCSQIRSPEFQNLM